MIRQRQTSGRIQTSRYPTTTYAEHLLFALLLIAALGLAACGGGGGGGGDGDQVGPSGTGPGNPSILTAVAQAVPANVCPNGGIEVKAGIDENLNGLLDDPGEVDIVQYVCNGANGTDGTNGTNGLNGLSALVAVTDEPAGANCVAGGMSVKSGPDTSGNGILDAAEVTSTDYICNGVNGTNGADVYAHRVNSAGTVQWAADGVAIATAANDQRHLRLVPDGRGGALIAWHDFRSGNWDIYAQRVNGGGDREWVLTLDGLPISAAAGTQGNPELISDGSGGAIIAWRDNRSGTNTDIYAQAVSADGTR
jgi:hypothetical protein